MDLRTIFSALVLLVGLEMAHSQNDGFWTTPAGGSWANAGNWLDGTIADGTDNTAAFGLSLYPVNPTTTFTLNGARTIGNLNFIPQNGPDNWIVNPGSGGPLTLDATFDYPALTLSLASLTVTLNVELAGTAGLEKLGAGTLVLTATNTYSGGTVVSGGALLVNGKIPDFDGVTVASGTLGGTGMISGPVTVQTGGLLTPGNSSGTLTISNALTLLAGSKTLVEVNATSLAHDTVRGVATLNYGGILTVSNLAGTPALGQSFQVFSAASSSGNFSTLTPQLTGGLRWRFDPANGVLSVVSTNLQPKFAVLALVAKTNLVMTVTNGVPGATNYLLAATNLILPRINWPRLATNVFDAGGNATFTNAIVPWTLSRFYSISPSSSP